MIQVRKLATAEAFLAHVASLGVSLPFVEDPPPAHADRYAILPMEGWDATDDGRPTELVERRWRRFGESGAQLIWGGEAVAVRADGRANPRQLLIGPEVAGLREVLLDAHAARYGADAPAPTIGLQLTHSGRYAVTGPLVAYAHPVLDSRATAPVHVLSDDELDDLVADFGRAARVAADAGFDFVDLKACHGYLGHELLSAVDRPGPYGGASLEARTTFLRRCVAAVRSAAPGLDVGVRVSAFDLVPHRPSANGSVGEPEPDAPMPYAYAFGGDGTGLGIDLREPKALLDLLVELGIRLVCVTAGSPYYSPHVQRPAFFPPSDGYLPPEDPLVGVARLLAATAELKAHRPELTIVGTGYSYLQEWLPHVAAGVVRPPAGAEAGHGGADWIGLGRMALSYHDLPDDLRNGRPFDRRRICRTFSDCTTAPRNGLVSGCWPLDPFYKSRPDRPVLAAAKKASRTSVADV